VTFWTNFSAAMRRADKRGFEGMGVRGKSRSFVVQDKGTAVRYGIFGLFPNELAAFPLRRRS